MFFNFRIGKLRGFMLCKASLTGSEEHKLTRVNLPSDVVRGFAAQPLGRIHLVKIHNGAAAVADEVDMGLGVSVKPFDPMDHTQALDQPLVLEQGEVAVNRCQRDVRMFLLQHFMHHLSGRMGSGTANTGENRAALTEMLCSVFHGHLLFLIFENHYCLRIEYNTGDLFLSTENKNYSHFIFQLHTIPVIAKPEGPWQSPGTTPCIGEIPYYREIPTSGLRPSSE